MNQSIKILETQFYLILNLTINIDYILSLNKIQQEGREEALLDRNYINYIARLSMDDIIIKVCKLGIERESYSFNELIRQVNLVGEIKDRNKFEIFEKILIDIETLFEKLKFKDLRDKHVAHMDKNRLHIPIDILEWKQLIDLIEDAYNNIYFALKKCNVIWDIEKSLLTYVLHDNKRLLELVETNRKNLLAGMEEE